MKNKLCFLLILLLFSNLNAQIIKISSIKSNVDSHKTSIIKSQVDTFEVFNVDLGSVQFDRNDTIELSISEKFNWILNLEPNELLTDDCILTISDGFKSKLIHNNNVYVYKGYANNNPEDEVRLTFYGDKIEGFIEQGLDRYYIEPLADFTNRFENSNLVLYNSKNYKGVKEDDFQDFIIVNSKEELTTKGSLSTQAFMDYVRYLRIATDADYEFYQIHGSESNNKILAVLNQIESAYTSTFNVKFRVVFQNVYSTSDDPYTFEFDLSEASSLLGQFRTEWNNNRTAICRDVAQFYSGKSQSSGVYGIAYLGQIFQTSTYAFNAVKNRTLMHLTSAHELGHNFNALDNPSDGNCGNNQSSVMCQGEKKDPPFFSSISTNEIVTFIGNHDYLTNHTTSYSSLICNSGASTYTVNNVPTNFTLQWNKSANINLTSYGNWASLSSNGNGTGWFNASTIRPTSCSCGNITLDTKNVWVGTPLPEVTGPTEGSVGNSYTYYVNTTPEMMAYYNVHDWSLSPYYEGNAIYDYDYWASAAFYAPQEGLFQISSTAQNNCGTGYGTRYIYIYNYGDGYSIAPNPASSEIIITVVKPEFKSNDPIFENTIYEVSVYDINGIIQSKNKYSGDKFSVPVYNLKNGTYIIQIFNGKSKVNKQLIIKH